MILALHLKCRPGASIRLDVKDQKDAEARLKDIVANGMWVGNVFYPAHQLDFAETFK